jgi:hypothetical protein
MRSIQLPQDEREAFEAWYERTFGARAFARNVDHSYQEPETEMLWAGWQARAARPAQTEQPPIAVQVCKLGIYGKAYDAPCEAHGNDMPKPAQHAERQQAVHWRAVLDPAEVPMQLNPHEHIAGFTDRRKAEDWIAARLCMDGWHYTLEPLYASPPPAQDGSALVEALEAIVRQYPNPDITHVDYRVQACKQAEHALEAYRATLAAQGAAGA